MIKATVYNQAGEKVKDLELKPSLGKVLPGGGFFSYNGHGVY